MFDEKGPITGLTVLTNGVVDLFVSPFAFFIKYVLGALMLPVRFLSVFFDPSTP